MQSCVDGCLRLLLPFHRSSCALTQHHTTGEGWEGFLQEPKYKNVYMDTHFYLLFDPNLWQSSPQELTNYVCQVPTTLLLF